jgi:hypothetical protein
MRVVFLVFGACMCALDTMENMALSHLAIRLIKLSHQDQKICHASLTQQPYDGMTNILGNTIVTKTHTATSPRGQTVSTTTSPA